MNEPSPHKTRNNRTGVPVMLLAGLIGAFVLVLIGYLVGLDPTIAWVSAGVSFVAGETIVIYLVIAQKHVTQRELVRWGVVFVISVMIIGVLFFASRGAFMS